MFGININKRSILIDAMKIYKITIYLSLFFIFINIFSEDNKYDFHIGFEISELMQNNFQNIGPENFTFLFGQKFNNNKIKNFGYRFLLINVELSPEHINNNPFIIGDKSNLNGKLFECRVYIDWYPVNVKWKFLLFAPIMGIGIGYHNTIFNNNEIYDFKALTFSANLRLQYELFDYVFFEFPVSDLFVHLWKNRSSKGIIENTTINYPEWGMVFFWINMGIKIKF